MTKTELLETPGMQAKDCSHRGYDGTWYRIKIFFTVDDSNPDDWEYFVWDFEVRKCSTGRPLHPDADEVDFFTKVEILQGAGFLTTDSNGVSEDTRVYKFLADERY